MQAEAEKLFQEKGDTPGMKQLAQKIETLKQVRLFVNFKTSSCIFPVSFFLLTGWTT